MHLLDTDMEANDSDRLLRRRKRTKRLLSDSSECSGIVDISSEEGIWKEIDNAPEIKKLTGVPGINSLIL